MNNDAQSPSTYRHRNSPNWLIWCFVLLANLFYATLASSQIVGTGHLSVERRSHSATLLENGMVLIVGGDNQNGIVSQSEIFDPISQTSALTAALIAPRTDHSATRLSDGTVLVIGGRDQNSSLQSTEIYKPLTTSFVAGPAMMRARSGHTATVLANDKILVTGGDLFGSAEIYDPLTQSFSLLTGSLNTPRKFHSALLLENGQVMIVGGINAQDAMLNAAEVFDPSAQTFYLPPTDMQTPRAFATLKLLPDGKVQIIGGDAELSMEVFDPSNGIFIAKALLPPNADLLGATLSTHSRAALFSPTISQDPILQGILNAEQLSLLDRADQSITELPERNQALVVGGVNSAGQVLNSAKLVSSSVASITTDKTDYAPGQIVTIMGSGFQPNESVDIYFHEFPEEYPDVFLSATANQQGDFVVAEFAPQEIDVGRIFTITAIGQVSGVTAQTAFKDNKGFTITFAGTGGGSITFSAVTGSPGPTTNPCTATCSNQLNNDATGTLTVTANAGSVFAGWSGSFTAGGTTTCTGTASSCNFSLNNKDQSLTATFNTVVATKLAFGAQPTNTNKDAAVTPAVTVRILDASSNLVTSSTRNVTLTIGTNPNSGTLAGTTTVAAVGGIATFSNLSINNAGNGYTLIASSALPTPALTTATSTVFNINKLAQTITFGAPVTKTYGDAPFVMNATGGASGNAVTFSSQTPSICTTSGTNGSTVTILAAGTCTIRASQLGNSNYNAANNVDQSFTVSKAALTVSADNQSRAYGASNPTLTASISGFANSETLAGSGVTGTASCSTTATVASPASPPTYPITCTIGTLASNKYSFSFVAGALTINKASQTITGFAPSSPLPYSSGGTFALSATGGASGNPVIFASTIRSVCTVSGSTATIVSPGTCSLTADQAGNGNYEAASQVSANVVINKASQTIIFGALAPKTFGDADFTVSATGGASGNPVKFSSQTMPACTVSGNTVHIMTAGSCTIRASQEGNANYDAAADVDQSFTINKAIPTVTVSGGPFTYDGNPHGATVAVTGVAGVAVTGTTSVTYNGSATVPMNADTYAVDVSFTSSDTNYNNANGSGSITITKAPSVTLVTCPASVIFNGSAQTPCTATVTGVGGLNQALTVNYAENTNAGTATASASYAESANYLGSTDSKSFTIIKAPSVTLVTCPASVIFNGSAQTPCTAIVTGVGGLNQALTVNYAENTNAGTATASASYAGDANHNGSTDSKSFTIEKASSTTTVTFESGPYTYRGTGFTATAGVTGVGGLNKALPVVYTADCTNVTVANGCVATATFAGDANHKGSSETKNITINRRPITVTADPKTKIYSESDPALTYQVTSGSLVFGDIFTGALSRVAGELVGTYAIQQNTLSINNIGNYALTYTGANLTITTGFAFNGFYSPIGGSVENGDGGSYANPLKTFKLGSTIPVKFGVTWLTGGAALITGIHTLQAIKYSNTTDSDPPIDATPTDGATTGNQFRLTSTDWHFNLSTKGNGFTAGTWLLSATLVDGSQHTVWISIKK